MLLKCTANMLREVISDLLLLCKKFFWELRTLYLHFSILTSRQFKFTLLGSGFLGLFHPRKITRYRLDIFLGIGILKLHFLPLLQQLSRSRNLACGLIFFSFFCCNGVRNTATTLYINIFHTCGHISPRITEFSWNHCVDDSLSASFSR